MKRALWAIVVLGLVAGLAWVGGAWYASPKKVPAEAVAASPVSQPSAPAVHPPPPLMAPGEWPKYRSARDAALAAHPELQAEYKGILKEMDAQQAKLDAALIKADPKIKPVIAKLVALRRKNGAPTAPSPGAEPGKPTATTPVAALTQEDMQELRTARAQALQSDPDLIADPKRTAGQMRDFEGKLDAAMIKADPGVSLVIAKFDGGGKPAAAPGSAPSSPAPMVK